MQQIKFKTFTEDSIERLEKSVNDFLKSDEGSAYSLLNITIKQIEERKFPNIEEDYNAIVTLVTKE
ncbi:MULTISPECIES: hypothetical protein [Staphylococcus]|jgi:hypothetical protein|uniref:Phage protein n=2 Tax=Staphylococcus capitis TaxID=29388 RepID=A0A4Q9WJL2_STACP|nr:MULTISPECIES: hypothetical protein [Staphylococcus]AKL91771.1 hypothetical protein AYP1020_0624 [Staphylococcus capitis subsp. capitis]EEE49551.1 hypothetical protein STACA0001_1559 [Staphylococcus capitis SK14]EFS17401.1 conserved hypothetical protein [Staphylococcus capitis C87]EGS37761.1 hypothetical protein SEVCU116_0449 [Staphylococcus capitis VCU116]KDE96112.1 hypothetical protein CM54_03530 [Staphylococcus sp. TE8]